MFSFTEMTREHVLEIANWKYPSPYDIYDWKLGLEEEMEEILSGNYFAALRGSDLWGYLCLGLDGQVPGGYEFYQEPALDIGLGMKPDYCGLGDGRLFVESGIYYLRNEFSHSQFRLTVANFNKRAITVYKRIGFEEIGRFHRNRNRDDLLFSVMKLTL